MREGTVTDPRDPGAGPLASARPARKGDRIDRDRRRLAQLLDQLEVTQSRREKPARPGIGERQRPLDALVEQRRVMRLGPVLEEQVGPRIDEKASPTALRIAAIRRTCSFKGCSPSPPTT